MSLSTNELVRRARMAGTVIPAFNIPYLPMMEPTIRALMDTNTLGMVAVARLEWTKFQAQSIEAIAGEYRRLQDRRHVRLHLDHIPVIDEDNLKVDYLADIKRALDAGYESVMVDGSRLPLKDNIACTRQVVEMAHGQSIAVEAELGAVMGHEAGPLPPYEELFASGKGFTSCEDARQFVQETGVDWLSVAIGNVHGAIAATRDKAKVEARLDITRLSEIATATKIPLVLHGGTGIRREYILQGIRNGIAKINIATATRQPYERFIGASMEKAQQQVYEAAIGVLRDELQAAGNLALLNGDVQ